MEALFSELTAETNARAEASASPPRTPGSGRTGGCPRRRNGRAHPVAEPVDELFGPLVDLPAEERVGGHADLRGRRVGLVPRRRRRRRRGRLGVTRRPGVAGRRRAGRPAAGGRHVHGRGAAAATRRARGWCRPGCPTAASGAARPWQRPRPARRARGTRRAGPRPRPRAPRHLPARAAPGQAPRRPDRPGRSRRLVAACCSSCRTGRLSHRAVDVGNSACHQCENANAPRRCASGGEGMRPWRSDAGRSVGAVAGMPIARPRRCAPAAPTASKTSSPWVLTTCAAGVVLFAIAVGQLGRDAHAGPVAGRVGGPHPRPRRAAGGRRRRRAGRRHPARAPPSPAGPDPTAGVAQGRVVVTSQHIVGDIVSIWTDRTGRARARPHASPAPRRRWAGRGVWPSRSAAGRCWRSLWTAVRAATAAPQRGGVGPRMGGRGAQLERPRSLRRCDTLVRCTTTSPPSAPASPR